MSEGQTKIAAVLYVALAGGLAAAGALAENPLYYAAAVLVTLPLGLLAFVAVYGGYAVVQAIGGVFASTTTADGSQASWLSASSGILNCLLFVAAATGNLLILRNRRRPPPESPVPLPEEFKPAN
jgi:hypothetical protein